MTTVNYANTNIDQTVRVFDSFYDYDANIPAGEYDIVNSYFLSVMKTKQAAGNFTVSFPKKGEEGDWWSTKELAAGMGLVTQLHYFFFLYIV